MDNAIGPVLTNPILDGSLLTNITLASGANIISHKLGRKLIGWFVTRRRANVTIYDTQDTNTIPDLTLNLTASGAVTVDLYVF